MKKRNIVFAIALVVLGVSLACNLGQPSATPAPATEAPGDLTAPPPPPSTGVSMSLGNVSFVIPVDVASGATSQAFPRAEGQDVAPWDVTPGHTAITLQGYSMQGSFHDPQIFVYPAEDYAALSPGAAESLKRLKVILAQPNVPYPNESLPYVPFFEAGQVFSAQEKVIPFAGGTGVRVVTQYAQDVEPVNNGGMIYHFEGLTADGKYYVIAVFPASLPFLPADNDPHTQAPADGVPFPPVDSMNATTFNSYYDAITRKIDSTDTGAFAPSLDSLDLLVGSLAITP